MNYLNLEEVKDLVSNLSRGKDTGFELVESSFNSIKINNFEVVCIAGPTTNSIPKDLYPSIDDYTEISVIIAEFNTKTNKFDLVKPCQDERFSYFNWTIYFKYKFGSYMGVYIPKAVIYQIIKDIYKISNLMSFF